MKRADKISLLTKVLQEGTSQTNRQRLQQAVNNGPRSLIIIDNLYLPPGQPITDDDPVSFKDRGKEHTMMLHEAHQYARRYQISTLVVLPAKRSP